MTVKQTTLPAVLDMGNSHIRVLVADVLADGALVVQGIGEAAAAGMEEGRIVDLGKATAALQRAVRTAELDSNRKIQKVAVAVSGKYIKSYANEGKTVIGGRDRRASAGERESWHVVGEGSVDEHDIYKVREMGVAAVAESDVEVLDVMNKSYRLDSQHNIRNPLGMAGRLLTGSMHVIVAERQSLENMEKCIEQAGMTLAGRVVFSGLAAAQAVLSEEEKQLGVCLLDIGAQTTEMVIFFNGGVYETDVYLEAANLIHTDISQVHHTTPASAEKCKKMVGVTIPPGSDKNLELTSTSGEEVSIGHSLVLRTVTSRVEMLLDCVGEALRHFEGKEERKLTAGVVLTGGGALLPGLVSMITNRLHIPVRLGLPAYHGAKHERVKTPQFAVATGLLMMRRAAANDTLSLAERAKNYFFHSLPNKEKSHGH